MPQYLDHHPTIPDMPPEMVAFITQRLTSGQPAVRRSHQALGIDLDPRDVAEVQVLP
jgi:hypothetical protein